MISQLQPITPAQAQDLLPFIVEFNAANGIETPVARVKVALAKLLSDPSLCRAWFIEHEGTRVGYVVLTFGYDMEYGGRDAWITDFFVRPEFRKKGIGTQALSLLELEATRLEVCALHLMVHQNNKSALHVYGGRGFEKNQRMAMIKVLGGS